MFTVSITRIPITLMSLDDEPSNIDGALDTEAGEWLLRHEICLLDAITDDQKEQIRASLDEGVYFYPECEGQPPLSTDRPSPDSNSPEWHSLLFNEITTEVVDIDAPRVTASIKGTVEGFVARLGAIQACRDAQKVIAESERALGVIKTRFIRGQIEQALNCDVPKGKVLRLTSEPGVGRNRNLDQLLDKRGMVDNAFYLALPTNTHALNRDASGLVRAKTIIIDGLNFASPSVREQLINMIVTRTLICEPMPNQAGGSKTLPLRDDVTIIVSDTELGAEIDSLPEEYEHLFHTVNIAV